MSLHRWSAAGQGLACLALLTCSLAATATSAACPTLEGEGVRQLVQADVKLSWKPLPSPIPLNKTFEMDVVLCGAESQLVRVDADMPAHRHGMNYRATVTAAGAQRSRVKGLVFHMPGQWRLIFDVQRGSERLRLTDTVQLP